jgi:hypothetical protein
MLCVLCRFRVRAYWVPALFIFFLQQTYKKLQMILPLVQPKKKVLSRFGIYFRRKKKPIYISKKYIPNRLFLTSRFGIYIWHMPNRDMPYSLFDSLTRKGRRISFIYSFFFFFCLVWLFFLLCVAQYGRVSVRMIVLRLVESIAQTFKSNTLPQCV